MIFMPPRHGKSELASRRFPAWYMGRNPQKEIIAASYNSDLAGDFGRDVRNIVNSPEYERLFDTRLAPDSKAKNRWNTSVGGGYAAAGVGTAVTGRGADVFLIDDPVKDRAEAESETTREAVYNWYTSTAYTRLMPGGAIVLIQTRWHEDDLAGRLLEKEAKGGDQWEKLILPAIDDAGEALWPERYPVEALERIRNAIGPRDWGALYQQNPTPDEGSFFKRAWFKRHEHEPPHCRYYGFSDYAVTADGGDFTEHAVVAVAPDGTAYVVDWWFGQTSADVWIERKLDMIERHSPLAWFGEAGVIQKAIEPMLRRRMDERRVYCRMEWVPSIHDKPTRARSIQARAAMGKVSIMEGPQGDRVLDQCSAFPAGKNDDAVDVLGMVGRAIDEAWPGVLPPEEAPQVNPVDRYRPKAKRSTGWRTV